MEMKTMGKRSETSEIAEIAVISPASITCMFTPVRKDDPKKSGSYGVGIALKNGSACVCRKTAGSGVKIRFSGCGEVETVLKALSILLHRMDDCVGEDTGVELELKPNYPVGCGFGMSASLTLSALLSLHSIYFLHTPHSSKCVEVLELADIAHEAEVLSSTGLGDVVTQVHGGIVCRLKPACPSLALVKKVQLDVRYFDVLVLGELDTGEALREYDFSTGVSRMKEFIRRPTVEELFRQSKAFAIESGVMDDEVLDVVEAVEAGGGMASMVMLGKAVFAVNGFDAMKEFGEPFRAEIDFGGLLTH